MSARIGWKCKKCGAGGIVSRAWDIKMFHSSQKPFCEFSTHAISIVYLHEEPFATEMISIEERRRMQEEDEAAIRAL